MRQKQSESWKLEKNRTCTYGKKSLSHFCCGLYKKNNIEREEKIE